MGVHGGLVLEMIHQEVDEEVKTAVLLGAEEGTLVREEVLLQEEALHLGETLAVMRTVEEVLLIVTVVEPGAAEATGLLVEEALLRDVDPHQEEGLHQEEALLPVEEAVMMDLLTGAVTDLLLLLLLLLPVMTLLPNLVNDQPETKMTAGLRWPSVNTFALGIVRAF